MQTMHDTCAYSSSAPSVGSAAASTLGDASCWKHGSRRWWPERLALDIFLDRPVLYLSLQTDELPLQESLDEVREIAPAA
jgi:hypothetical protein